MPEVATKIQFITQLITVSSSESEDFTRLSQTLTFSSSSPELQCVGVATTNDSLPELPEEFTVVLESVTQPDPQISVEPSLIEVLITNDDGMATRNLQFKISYNVVSIGICTSQYRRVCVDVYGHGAHVWLSCNAWSEPIFPQFSQSLS